MAKVIDLSTGEIIEDDKQAPAASQQAPAASQPPTETKANEVINLETGAIEEHQPLPSLEDSIVKDEPVTALTGLTPEEAAELPEIGVLENQLGGGKAFKLALGAMLSSEPAQQIEIIQSVLPDAKINTFESGETVVDYQGQKFILNKPGFSATDATRFVGQFLAFLPVGKATQLGKAAVVKAGLIESLKPLSKSAINQRIGQMVGAASSSAAISVGLDAAAEELAGEEGSQGISKERAILSAVFGGTGELIGPAFRGVVRKFRGTPNDLKYINIPEVAQIKEAGEKTGIRIFEPQGTKASADSMYMRALQDLPETQRRMAFELEQQNQDVSAAVTRYITDIGSDNSILTAPKEIRNLAVAAIDEMKLARTNLVSQGYTEAFAAGTKVDVAPTLSAIDGMLAKTSSSETNPVRMALLKYKDQIQADAVDGLNDLEILDGVKKNLDAAIDGFGESSVDQATKTQLKNVRTTLRSEMEEASPLYDQVKSIFADASGPIREMEDSLIGKVAGIKDVNLKKVLTSIFDATESNPAVLKKARSIIESQSPDAWQHLVRANLSSRIGKVGDGALEGTSNMPALMLTAMFGPRSNTVQRRMLLDSLTPEQQGNARWLEIAMKAAARGRRTGSDTAGKTEAIKGIKGEFAGDIDNYFNPMQWGKKLTGIMKQAKFERRADALIDALTSEKWHSEMSKLKQLNATDSATGRSLVQLLTRIESEGVDGDNE